MEDVKEYIMQNEGLRLTPYKDIFGNTTIGYGRNLSGKGITKEEAVFLMENDLKECICDLKEFIFHYWDTISPNRQMVLLDMRFQLGRKGFRNFKKMITAVQDENWAEAAKQIEQSNYCKQVPARAKRNIALMENG